MTRDAQLAAAGALATLVKQRRALPEGLRAMAEDADVKAHRRLYLELANAVEKGADLSEALAEIPRASAVAIAELCRELDSAAAQMAALTVWTSFQQRSRVESWRFRRWLAYPLVVLLLSFVVLMGFQWQLGKVVQAFSYMSGPVDIPWLMMISLSEFVVKQWPLILGGAVMVTAMGVFGFPRALRQRMLLVLPLYGPALYWHLWSMFFRLMASLMAVRVPLPTITRALEKHFYHTAIRRPAHQIAAAVRLGRPLVEAFERTRRCPNELAGVLNGAGTLEETQTAIELIADMAYQEWLTRVRMLQRIVPVVLLVLGGAVIGVAFMTMTHLMMTLFQALGSI